MCRLLETVKVARGRPCGLQYHNLRLNRSRFKLFGARSAIDLAEHIRPPHWCEAEPLVRCRVLCRETVESVEYLRYRLPVIASFKIVYADDIEYPHKREDRAAINALFTRRGIYDEIIIVKDNRITDASIANLVFFDGGAFFTPARPLLSGTKRVCLLEQKIIREEEIALEDLPRFQSVFLINSMIDLEDRVGARVENIVP